MKAALMVVIALCVSSCTATRTFTPGALLRRLRMLDAGDELRAVFGNGRNRDVGGRQSVPRREVDQGGGMS